MTKQEQIEEMAKIIALDGCGDCSKCNEKEKYGCYFDAYKGNAEALYNAGYRKQGEVAKEMLSTLKNYCIKRHNCFAELRNKNLKAHVDDNALFDLGQMDFANCLLNIMNELSEKYGVEV